MSWTRHDPNPLSAHHVSRRTRIIMRGGVESWSSCSELNREPSAYKAGALPIELQEQISEAKMANRQKATPFSPSISRLPSLLTAKGRLNLYPPFASIVKMRSKNRSGHTLLHRRPSPIPGLIFLKDSDSGQKDMSRKVFYVQTPLHSMPISTIEIPDTGNRGRTLPAPGPFPMKWAGPGNTRIW